MDGQGADGEGVVPRDPTTEPLPLTETRNPRTLSIDAGSTAEVLAALNTEDQLVADAVASQIPRIARALDAVGERWEQGGRLFYAGAGTSGRLGVLDRGRMPADVRDAAAPRQGHHRRRRGGSCAFDRGG